MFKLISIYYIIFLHSPSLKWFCRIFLEGLCLSFTSVLAFRCPKKTESISLAVDDATVRSTSWNRTTVRAAWSKVDCLEMKKRRPHGASMGRLGGVAGPFGAEEVVVVTFNKTRRPFLVDLTSLPRKRWM